MPTTDVRIRIRLAACGVVGAALCLTVSGCSETSENGPDHRIPNAGDTALPEVGIDIGSSDIDVRIDDGDSDMRADDSSEYDESDSADSADTDQMPHADASDDATTTPDSASMSPATVDIVAGPSDGTTEAGVWIEFETSNARETMCSLEGGAESSCSSPWFVVPQGVGAHRADVRARGFVGDDAIASHNWTSGSVFTDTNSAVRAVPRTPPAVDPVQEPGWSALFRINCRLARTAYSTMPGSSEASSAGPLLQFYGNLSYDPLSDWSNLYEDADSTCQGTGLDASIYAVPAVLAPRYTIPENCDDTDPLDTDCSAPDFIAERVLQDGVPVWDIVTPIVGNDDDGAHEIIYLSVEVDDQGSAQLPPAGLHVIAGTPTAGPTDAATSLDVARWHCGSWGAENVIDGSERVSASIPACRGRDRLLLDVFFPGCWDGVRLVSDPEAPHIVHAVTSEAGRVCPESHPIALIRPSIHLQYPIRHSHRDPIARDTSGWRLATDAYAVPGAGAGGRSAHAGWINGWHPEILQAVLDDVLLAGRDAHNGNIGNGFALSDVTSGSSDLPVVVNEGREGPRD